MKTQILSWASLVLLTILLSIIFCSAFGEAMDKKVKKEKAESTSMKND